jgi:hypothetical protein
VHTCLFTGVALGPNTKEEHTIPRSMGGRLVSRAVSSNDFNNRCGSYCDDRLQKVYALLISRLAPLLPSASQPGVIPAIASGAPDGLSIEAGAILKRSKNVVLEWDATTKRPKKVLGADEESLRRFAKKAGMPVPTKFEEVPLIPHDIVTTRLPAFAPEIELAALKCVLLSFDFKLKQFPENFTRSPQLSQVREVIRKSVESKKVESDLFASHSLGMQLEKLPLYAALRESMCVEETPFEHYMLVAANTAQRCLDAVWVIFGFEPFGFRLLDRYEGESFCYGIVNPILKGQSASDLVVLSPPEELLCRPTSRRAFQFGDDPLSAQDAAIRAVNEIVQLLQMLTAVGLHWFLPQQIAAHRERVEKLVVQVVAIGHHHQRRVGHLGGPHQRASEHEHGQALA